jgi:anti-anti-sigma regulatory factor
MRAERSVKFSAPAWLRDLGFASWLLSAGLDALGDLCDDLARNGVTLRVARMKTPVRDQLEEAGIAERIGRARFHLTVRAAVSA